MILYRKFEIKIVPEKAPEILYHRINVQFSGSAHKQIPTERKLICLLQIIQIVEWFICAKECQYQSPKKRKEDQEEAV